MNNNDAFAQIEDIVLQDDMRGMTALKPHMPDGYMESCADLLLDHPGTIFIVTGFYIISAEQTETDGPPGAVAIGNALAKLGNDVVYVTDEFSSEVVRTITEDEVIEFPITNHFESANFANQLVEERSPSALVAIERAGLIGDGTYRNMRGIELTPFNAKIDHLFDQHPYSVGIGDGGNEIGMGNLQKRDSYDRARISAQKPVRDHHDGVNSRELLELGWLRANRRVVIKTWRESLAQR